MTHFQSGRSGGVGTGRTSLNPPKCPRVSSKQVEAEAKISYYEIKRDGKGMYWGKPIVNKEDWAEPKPSQWITIGQTNYLAWLFLYVARMDVYAKALKIIDEKQGVSICEALEEITDENPELVFSGELDKYYPEVFARKPVDIGDYGGYWWNHWNYQPRIKLLKDVLKEMQGNINNGVVPKY
jgi:hypothetical protein